MRRHSRDLSQRPFHSPNPLSAPEDLALPFFLLSLLGFVVKRDEKVLTCIHSQDRGDNASLDLLGCRGQLIASWLKSGVRNVGSFWELPVAAKTDLNT